MKRFIITSTLVFALLFSSISVVSATTYSYNSSGKSFSKAWSSTPINTADRTMKYGYNTTGINEDYTHTYHKTKSHKAYVKNTARAQSKPGEKGKYAKPEITHAKGTVYYQYSY